MQKNLLIKFTLLLNLIGLGFLLFGSVLNDSPTFDEPPHILSGYVALKYGENYIDPEHPLLIKSFASAPLVVQNLEFDQSDPNYVNQDKFFDVGKMFDASRKFLQDNDMDQIMLATRIPMILLTVFFGFVVFLFTKKLFNTQAALLATLLYSTEPVILANGPLVNTDLAASGFIITTVFALFLYSEHQSPKRLIFLVLALTGALLSKFSTFYLVPIVLVLMEFIYRKEKNFPRLHMVYLLGGLLAIISIFYGVISFRTEGLAGFIPVQYFKGLVIVFAQAAASERFSYLLGESYFGSRWYYFPVLVATKTQLLTLFGFALGIFFLWKKHINLNVKQLAIFFSPLALFFSLALAAKFNIGVRHVLPIYPFLIVFAAGAFTVLGKLILERWKSLVLVIAFFAAIVSLRVWSVVTTYPHFLSYYNVTIGTDNGWKVTNDSNYDWGQDVKRLARFVEENQIKSIAFDNYSGNFAAEYYGVPITPITPKDTNYKGYLALSTSVIVFYEDQKDNYSWIVDKYQPIARAGKSIFIYKIP